MKFSELNCIKEDFKSIFENFDSSTVKKEEFLRLKSIVERGERYANSFTEDIINLF